MILRDGKWIDPKSEGLVQYEDGRWMTRDERFVEEQKALGKVLYNGQWMSSGDMEQAIKAEKESQGLMLFEGRWMTAEQIEAEKVIKAKALDVARNPNRSLAPPEEIGVIPQDNPRVRILNGAGDPIMFIFSGPVHQQFPLDPYQSRNVDVPAGSYTVCGVPMSASSLPSLLKADFEKGRRYSIIDEGMPIEVKTTSETVTPESIRTQYDIPVLEIPDEPTTKSRAISPEDRRGQRGGGPPRGMRR